MEHVNWTDKIKNAVVLERVGEGRIMLELIKKRKRIWLGHWLRRNCLLKDDLEGMVNGKKVRGLRRYQMIDNIMINRLYEDTKKKAGKRVEWRMLSCSERPAFGQNTMIDRLRIPTTLLHLIMSVTSRL